MAITPVPVFEFFCPHMTAMVSMLTSEEEEGSQTERGTHTDMQTDRPDLTCPWTIPYRQKDRQASRQA